MALLAPDVERAALRRGPPPAGHRLRHPPACRAVAHRRPAPRAARPPPAAAAAPRRGPRRRPRARHNRHRLGPLPRRHRRHHDHRRHRGRRRRRPAEHPARRRRQPHGRAGQPAAPGGARSSCTRGGDNPRVLNSDTIILLHVPEDGGAAVAFSIPRDAYVDIPGYRTDKINAAYPAVQALDRAAARRRRRAATAREIDAEASAQAGRTALIGAVEQLTGVTVDHFAEVNLLGFYNLTQAIGGVDVCLKAPVDDPLSGAHFPAGPQTVSGGDALAFVRQRHGLPQGDLSRIRRQQVFLAAVADKILAGGTLTDPTKLSALVGVDAAVGRPRPRLGPARLRPAGVRHRGGQPGVPHRADAGHRDQRPRQRRARRPGPGARLRRAARRGAGGGGAPGPRGRRPAPTPRRPSRRRRWRSRRRTTWSTSATARAPTGLGRARSRTGSSGWASSAARSTTPPTRRRRWSATATAATPRRRWPRSSAGSTSSRTTPCRPGTCRWCWAPTRRGRIPGLAAPAPATTAPTTAPGPGAEQPITAAGVPCVD